MTFLINLVFERVKTKQLFPIMPIHRLDEKPTALGTLADLTCDSDGKVDRFITTGTEDTKVLLELHVPEPDKPYLLGMFLAGAYQVCVCLGLDAILDDFSVDDDVE